MSARAMEVLRRDALPEVAAYIEAQGGVWIADPEVDDVWGWFPDDNAVALNSPLVIVYDAHDEALSDFEVSDRLDDLLTRRRSGKV